MIDVLRIRFSGPLKPFAAGFATELAKQGYTPNSARLQLRLMAHVSRWLAGEGLDSEGLTSSNVVRFLGARRAAGYTTLRTDKAMRPMLTYLRQLGVVPRPPPTAPSGPLEEVIERYRHYLTVERGLGAPTARGYIDAVRPFLHARLSPDGLRVEFDQLSATEVRAFVVARCPAQSRGAAKMTVSSLIPTPLRSHFFA